MNENAPAKNAKSKSPLVSAIDGLVAKNAKFAEIINELNSLEKRLRGLLVATTEDTKETEEVNLNPDSVPIHNHISQYGSCLGILAVTVDRIKQLIDG